MRRICRSCGKFAIAVVSTIIVWAFSLTTGSLLESWQDCSIFLAPSSSGGYGVFAARDFAEGEIVELAPFFLADEHDVPFIMNTVLQDYIYGYLRILPAGEDPTEQPPQRLLSAIVWGLAMMYNHHPQAPNIRWSSFGNEPAKPESMDVRAMGFFATRFISRGEELLSSYGEQDGGTSWFQGRGITMITTSPESNKISADQLNYYQQQYCSKIYANLDDMVFAQRLQSGIAPPLFYAPSRLAPSAVTTHNDIRVYDDPNYPHAVAKVPIRKGNRIELSIALVLDRNKIVNTPLAPLVYYYHELPPELQASVQNLRREGYYVVQYQGVDNHWRREDHFTTFEESAILPVGGWIGRVERVDDSGLNSSINCRLRILPSDFHKRNSTMYSATQQQQRQAEKEQNPFSLGNAGIALELIATRDIAVGERLRTNIPSSATFRERLMLYKEMERSGQLYSLASPLYQFQGSDEL